MGEVLTDPCWGLGKDSIGAATGKGWSSIAGFLTAGCGAGGRAKFQGGRKQFSILVA